MPTKPYEHDSDSQHDIVTTGGKLIISSSDKVEISVEYLCDDSLPDATKESTGITASEMTSSDQCESSRTTLSVPRTVPDETNDEINLTNELPDDTTPSENVLPDETANKSMLSNTTDPSKTSNGVLPYDTVSENNFLSDETKNNESVNTREQQLSVTSTVSTDTYPDTTATASTLHEATDTTNKDLTAEMPSNEDVGIKKGNNTTASTTIESDNEVSLDATTNILPDETIRPSIPLPDATVQTDLQTIENSNSTTHKNKETEQHDLDSQKPAKPLDIEWQVEITTDLKENIEID